MQIICPHCHKALKKIKKYSNNSALYRCSCLIYPQIENILYLKNDQIRIKLINCLKTGKNFLHYFSFSLISKVFFRLFPIKIIIKNLGYRRFIKLLALIGYSRGWAKYLLDRRNIPSYILGNAFLNLINNKKHLVLDIGCSTGSFLPGLYKHSFPKNIVAIDYDFLNLYIARFCFAKDETVLICYDANYTLPFKPKTFNNIYIIDTLHYIKNIQFFVKNLKIITKDNFEGAIVHTLNTDNKKTLFTYRRKPEKVRRLLKKSGFTNMYYISNSSLWKQLIKDNRINLYNEPNINEKPVYNVIFTKKKTIKLSSNIFKKTVINYYQDGYLNQL
jgi:SAM-dependent methyltransferase